MYVTIILTTEHTTRKDGNDMKEIFKQAIEKLENKGYHVCNMISPANDHYELYNADSEVVMDWLTLGQLTQLAEFL